MILLVRSIQNDFSCTEDHVATDAFVRPRARP